MKRNFSVERLYTLGDYKNVKIINTIEQLEDVTPEQTRLVFNQLVAECDLAYQDYKAMNAEITKKANDGSDVRELLQEERDRIAQELAKGE